MLTAAKCICCMEVGEAAANTGSVCTTQHSDFFGAIRNPVGLQIAFRMRAIELLDRELVGNRETHRKHRCVAYHQFARWIWRRLGRHNRKILPACVVKAIRNAYPSEEYCGFRYPAL
ncbi:uncharacterized protein LOC120849761 [Ixodes scapularis]|uniref:uncharacterized protein LOC120849761 n=1 Tax=Ixodes scapularis TaxID=6945 RepID=UPI001A9DDEE7|nr:uncharacterized protein LOC120849761 [Ixodes scapularis]